jgi:hypothetical protein
MPDKRGWYIKYRVEKIDGSTDPEAVYFVLRLDTDRCAREAALSYAMKIYDDNRNFAMDIIRRVVDLQNTKAAKPPEFVVAEDGA